MESDTQGFEQSVHRPSARGESLARANGEVRSVSRTGGEKGVKPERYDLLPVEALDVMARLYGFGAQKYAAHNWRKGYDWSKSYAALMRHATRFWAGEDFDEETGLPHLAGAAFHCFTLIVFMEEHPEFDDRYRRDVQEAISSISEQAREGVRDSGVDGNRGADATRDPDEYHCRDCGHRALEHTNGTMNCNFKSNYTGNCICNSFVEGDD